MTTHIQRNMARRNGVGPAAVHLVLQSTRYAGNGKLILAILATFGDRGGREIWPSQARVAELAGCDVRTVKRWMKRYRADGVLVQTRPARRRQPARYWLDTRRLTWGVMGVTQTRARAQVGVTPGPSMGCHPCHPTSPRPENNRHAGAPEEPRPGPHVDGLVLPLMTALPDSAAVLEKPNNPLPGDEAEAWRGMAERLSGNDPLSRVAKRCAAARAERG